MAMVTCPECGKEVSSLAPVCPNCGYPIKEHFEKEEAETVNRQLLEKIVPCEFTVPRPRARVCAMCGSALDPVEKKCMRHFANYPIIEVDYPEIGSGSLEANLWIFKNIVEPRNIGDPQERQLWAADLDYQVENIVKYRHTKVVPLPPKEENFGKERLVYASPNVQRPTVIKCPTCGSTKVSKISTASRAVHGWAFGVLSKTARSQFKCESCGYKW